MKTPLIWARALPRPVHILRSWLLRLLFLMFVPFVVHAQSQTAKVVTEHVRAELVAHAPEGISPGKEAWIGLRIEHQPHWHTYWKNPGDSGLATSLAWSLPAGFGTGEILWRTPKPLPVGPLMNYGYEGDLLLSVPLTVPEGFNGPTLPVHLRADWLVCKDICIPESGEFKLDLATGPTATHAVLFREAQASQPDTIPGLKATARLEVNSLVVTLRGAPPAIQGKTVNGVFACHDCLPISMDKL